MNPYHGLPMDVIVERLRATQDFLPEAAAGMIERMAARIAEEKEMLVVNCVFDGPQPEPFLSWREMFTAKQFRNLYIRRAF